MMSRRVAREESLAGGSDVRVSDVGEDGNEGGAGSGGVGDDTCAELVGGAFEPEAEEAAGCDSERSAGWRTGGREEDSRSLERGEGFFLLVELCVMMAGSP